MVARVIQGRLQRLAERESHQTLSVGFAKVEIDMTFVVRQLVEKAVDHRA